MVAFVGGIDGSQPLFDFIIQFDSQFDSKGLETAERFSPIINNLKEKREKLFASLDMIMYHPVLLFGASEENRTNLIEYIKAWEQRDTFKRGSINATVFAIKGTQILWQFIIKNAVADRRMDRGKL